MKKIQNLVIALVASMALAFPMLAVSSVAAQADISSGLCAGSNLDVTQTGGCDPASNGQEAQQKVNDIIKLVINIFSLVVGVVAVIMIMIGGLKYITSGGDSGNISGAKNTILYAIIGLVVVALAQIVVKFVLSRTATT